MDGSPASLVISDSAAQTTTTLAISGAYTLAAAASNSYFRINNRVFFTLQSLITPAQNITATSAITLTGAFAADYRPIIEYRTTIYLSINAVTTPCLLRVLTNGDIAIVKQDASAFAPADVNCSFAICSSGQFVIS